MSDPVNHPTHYTSSPAACAACGRGIECIDITEHMGFALGNAVKYIWRADLKGDAIEDLRKARWYLDREITRREEQQEAQTERSPRAGFAAHRGPRADFEMQADGTLIAQTERGRQLLRDLKDTP